MAENNDIGPSFTRESSAGGPMLNRQDADQLEAQMKRVLVSATEIGDALTRGMTKAISSGERLDQILKSMVLDLAKLGLKRAFSNLNEQIFSGNKGGPLNGITDAFGALIGGFFGSGNLSAGITANSTSSSGFPLSPDFGPLARPSLMGQGAPAIQFNISSPDTDSFVRSQGQISAMLTRAVDRGRSSI